MFKIFTTVLCCLGLMCSVIGAEEKGPPLSPPETEPQEIATTQEATHSYENAFLKMLITLVALIFFVFLTFWMFRRMAQGRMTAGNSNRTIKILDKRALSTKSILYLIEVENKRVLIAESQLEVRPISNVENPIQLD